MRLHEEISVRWIILYVCILALLSGGDHSSEQPLPTANYPKSSSTINRSNENLEDSFRAAIERLPVHLEATEAKK